MLHAYAVANQLSTPVICVVTCVFRRFRITPSIKQLSTEGSYVGYEKVTDIYVTEIMATPLTGLVAVPCRVHRLDQV